MQPLHSKRLSSWSSDAFSTTWQHSIACNHVNSCKYSIHMGGWQKNILEPPLLVWPNTCPFGDNSGEQSTCLWAQILLHLKICHDHTAKGLSPESICLHQLISAPGVCQHLQVIHSAQKNKSSIRLWQASAAWDCWPQFLDHTHFLCQCQLYCTAFSLTKWRLLSCSLPHSAMYRRCGAFMHGEDAKLKSHTYTKGLYRTKC